MFSVLEYYKSKKFFDKIFGWLDNKSFFEHSILNIDQHTKWRDYLSFIAM